jgi:hypothetical protein
MQAVRFKSKWFGVKPRPYEPERQTADIAWMKLRGVSNPYRTWYENERRIARLLNVAPE